MGLASSETLPQGRFLLGRKNAAALIGIVGHDVVHRRGIDIALVILLITRISTGRSIKIGRIVPRVGVRIAKIITAGIAIGIGRCARYPLGIGVIGTVFRALVGMLQAKIMSKFMHKSAVGVKNHLIIAHY